MTTDPIDPAIVEVAREAYDTAVVHRADSAWQEALEAALEAAAPRIAAKALEDAAEDYPGENPPAYPDYIKIWLHSRASDALEAGQS